MFLTLLMGVAQISTGNMIFSIYMSLFININFLILGIQNIQDKKKKMGILLTIISSICIVVSILTIIRISIFE